MLDRIWSTSEEKTQALNSLSVSNLLSFFMIYTLNLFTFLNRQKNAVKKTRIEWSISQDLSVPAALTRNEQNSDDVREALESRPYQDSNKSNET